ncbi:hypothetical protein AB6A40_002766 [Gnathostoma spinigerum]|uniref:Uncharacterized protein n=1 Tax=Gnathostoma spinigerum TaxID=75299 RepID=A0ABD6EHL9_9BILA
MDVTLSSIFWMIILPLVVLSDSVPTLDSEDGDYEDEASDDIRWVPVVQRNLTELITIALQYAASDETKESLERSSEEIKRERLERIGKMLNASYQKLIRDTEVGYQKMKFLEQKGSLTQANPSMRCSMYAMLTSSTLCSVILLIIHWLWSEKVTFAE